MVSDLRFGAIWHFRCACVWRKGQNGRHGLRSENFGNPRALCFVKRKILLLRSGRGFAFGSHLSLKRQNSSKEQKTGLCLSHVATLTFESIKVLRKEKASCWGWGRGAICRFLLASPTIGLRQISNYYRHLVWIDSVTLSFASSVQYYSVQILKKCCHQVTKSEHTCQICHRVVLHRGGNA